MGSFSTAQTWSQRPESAKAIALPPAPAKVSMMMVLDAGAEATCSAIFLEATCQEQGGGRARVTHVATGSGVTPNQVSSVIQMPSSNLEKML